MRCMPEAPQKLQSVQAESLQSFDGQGSSWQTCVSSKELSQVCPLKCPSFRILRRRVYRPGPHEALHVVQDCQASKTHGCGCGPPHGLVSAREPKHGSPLLDDGLWMLRFRMDWSFSFLQGLQAPHADITQSCADPTHSSEKDLFDSILDPKHGKPHRLLDTAMLRCRSMRPVHSAPGTHSFHSENRQSSGWQISQSGKLPHCSHCSSCPPHSCPLDVYKLFNVVLLVIAPSL
mmetsp:Transcript_65119/g.153275  ORF Transcript_65119/g.153275 Transcript_65119/m.153275 type:complete len:233 (+) Transcript_65119:1034-1732(+)